KTSPPGLLALHRSPTLVVSARTNLRLTEGDSATCTRRSGLCSRGSARRSSPSVATVDLVAEKSFQVRRRSW
uniref:Uncharacterized protein n=1 Tax=Terrapene triunguis TaxID=2587831 RepID=A0A674J967_9SAUR